MLRMESEMGFVLKDHSWWPSLFLNRVYKKTQHIIIWWLCHTYNGRTFHRDRSSWSDSVFEYSQDSQLTCVWTSAKRSETYCSSHSIHWWWPVKELKVPCVGKIHWCYEKKKKNWLLNFMLSLSGRGSLVWPSCSGAPLCGVDVHPVFAWVFS